MLKSGVYGAPKGQRVKLLVFAPYGIGNLILLYPVLKKLQEDGVQFDIVSYLGPVRHLLENVEPFKDLGQKRYFIGNGIAGVVSAIRSIRRGKYSVSVMTFPSARPHYNLLSWLCGARRRIAARYPDDSFGSLSFLNTHLVPVTMGIHDVFQNLNLFKAVPLELKDSDIEQFGLKESHEKIIGFHPGCKKSGSFKRWPLEHWERLLVLIGRKFPAYRRMMFFGPDESEELEYFKRQDDVEIRASLKLSELFSEIGRCGLFVSNDSALMHIATMTGVTSISVFGPTDYRRTGPFSKEAVMVHGECERWPCSHSYYRSTYGRHCTDACTCMRNISPERVFATVEAKLALPGSS
jgi:ADP-heptose:LPS heptosyltransferase